MKSTTRKKILIAVGIFLVLAAVGVIKFIMIINELPQPEKIVSFQQTQSTKIYDKTGTVLLYEIHGDENRTLVSGNAIPPHIKQAVIAAEDQSFYSHSAIDFKGMLRALYTDILKGEFAQGGSTITQQLVKNVFLTPEKTLDRKVKEVILAYWIEREYSKDQIITFYLNQINFGSNSYGVESAAQRFFNKPSDQLTVAEAAYLAGSLKSPSYYSPWGSHLTEALQRKDYILLQMKNLGYLTAQEYTSATQQKLSFTKPNIGTIKAPHFSLMVKDYLEQKYGADLIERGGLRVVTTLDWNLQQAAEEAVKNGAEKNSKDYQGTNAALVAQEAKTGQVVALVGSADYFNEEIDGNFNVAANGLRQPGSTFKPIAYLTAFMKGYLPETIVFDTKTDFNTSDDPRYTYAPENYDGIFRGPISLRSALAQSINVPAVKVLYLAGIPDVLKTAKELGITTLTDPSRYGLSLVLGGGEVKLVDLVEAYSVFAQDGVKHDQSIILKVEDYKGKVYEEYTDNAVETIDPKYTRMVTSILSDTEARSGLFHGSLPLTVFDGYQVALKTGTTNDYRDAWTVGYTPSLVVGVWAGNSNSKPMVRQGGSILAALPMWSEFMRKAITSYPSEPFAAPEQIYSSVPMVNGQYIANDPVTGVMGIHSILYYVNKKDPTVIRANGYDPYSDPQFSKWEASVQQWITSHGIPLLPSVPLPTPSPVAH